MGNVPGLPTDWTEPEQWVWKRIAAGEVADLGARGAEPNDELDPRTEEGWGEDRRLTVKFLQNILTQKAFVEETPYGGVRIHGALIDDAPLNLEEARLTQQFCLEKSRILIDVKCNVLRVDGALSLEKCFVAGAVELNGADIRDVACLSDATVKGSVDLTGAKFGSNLEMQGSTFEGDVSLNGITVRGATLLAGRTTFKCGLDLTAAEIRGSLELEGSTFERNVSLSGATVGGAALLADCAIFKCELDLTAAEIGASLEMEGSTFEGDVSLNGATVGGSAFLRRATFKRQLNLGSATIGGALEMQGSTFEGDVRLDSATVAGGALLDDGATFNGELNLTEAKIGGTLEMQGSTFEGDVILDRATVGHTVRLGKGAIFKHGLNLRSAKIGSNLQMDGSTFGGHVDLTQCTVTGDLLLGSSEDSAARWNDDGSLILRNAHVGALQDFWRGNCGDCANAWPKTYSIEGFTYDRLGSRDAGREPDMLDRPIKFYIQWLGGDPGSSPQPYEHLARRFRDAGQPHKGAMVLYAARERRRRKAWSKVDDYDRAKRREWRRALGLWALRLTIGYGLGNRYFYVLWWVAGLTILGALVLVVFGSHPKAQWPEILFASLDQLLPFVTLNKTHDALIFGDSSAQVDPQPYGVVIYFYAQKIAGWVVGSFIVAGLAGLTQRN